MSGKHPFSAARRSFVARFHSGTAALAALAVGTVANAKPKPAARFEPARHDKDDWLDQASAKHRLLFDAISPDGLGDALAFGDNYIRVNKTDYGLEEKDLAVLLVLRHRATPFAYNDAIWAKYGAALAPITPIEDPKSKQAPVVNVYNTPDYANLMPSRGATIDSLTKKGVQVGVCSVATRGIAQVIAGKAGGNADSINKELIANLVPGARMVPAGIVAVNRAQERGYTLANS